MTAIVVFIFIIAGYLIGSIPWGVIVGKTARGVDVRAHGSGSMGTTNVLRTVGLKASLLVFLLDLSKGALPVLIAGWLTGSPEAQIAGALSALVGHNWPLFAGFRGGRGVTTSLGSLFVMAPWAGVAAFIVGLLVILASRYVSAGSIAGTLAGAAAILFLVAAMGYPQELLIYAPAAAALIVFQHRHNISRLIRGTEPKLDPKSSRHNPKEGAKV